MKTVNNKEVCEQFAKNAMTMTLTEVRGNGSIFIEGRVIYSYGKHHPIAIMMRRGEVRVNTDRYSNTTSKQTSMVRAALREAGVVMFDYSHTEERLDADNPTVIEKKLKYQNIKRRQLQLEAEVDE